VPVLAIAITWWLALPLPKSLHGHEWVLTTWKGFTSHPTFLHLNASMASFGYLLMDVVVLSWALVILVNARKAAGGMFMPPMRLVLLSLFAQYAADLLFDQRVVSTAHPYFTGDIATMLYMVSMYLMTFAIIVFAETERRLAAQVEEQMAALMAAMPAADPVVVETVPDPEPEPEVTADEGSSTSDAPSGEGDA